MTTLRRFTTDDLFNLGTVNLDPLTENYNISFYLSYLARWPEYFYLAESSSGDVMGYVMGKAEGQGKDWHGHVTALTVGPEYRRLGLGKVLMDVLESVSEHIHNGYFVDLFVRESNAVAIALYEALGYTTYRRVLKYYASDGDEAAEDAFDMRKALPRDVNKESVVPLKHPVRAEDI
ncbi:acyl-CoA N-acyltransferase [Blastocladiella britannica]|nr:acyl-CoA N-acyltransferase [Blastocladiella britannica]